MLVSSPPLSPSRAGVASRVWATVGIVVVIGLAYGNTLENGFVMDDAYLVVGNTQIRSWRAVLRTFVEANAATAATDYDRTINRAYWRPLTQVSYALDYALWGLRPAGFHLTNLLLHAAVCVLLLWIITALTGSLVVAAIAAVLFALHPVHTEAVNLITYRTELLAAFFVLAALSTHLRYGDRWWCALLLVPLLYAAGLASKETAVTMPGWLALVDLARGRLWGPRRAALGSLMVTYLPLVAVLVGYLGLRQLLLQQPAIDFFAGLDGGLLLLSVAKIYRLYLRLMVAPWPLLTFYDWTVLPPATSWLDLDALAGLVALLATVALPILFWRRQRWFAVGLGWWLLGLIPFAHLVALPVGAGERFLYLSSIGFLVSVAVVLAALARCYRRSLLVASFVAVFGMATLTLQRNTHWRSDLTLQQQAARDFPRSAMVHYNLALIYDAQGDTDRAIVSYARANRLLPNMVPIVMRLARLYLERGQRAAARSVLEAAIAELGSRPDLIALWRQSSAGPVDHFSSANGPK